MPDSQSYTPRPMHLYFPRKFTVQKSASTENISSLGFRIRGIKSRVINVAAFQFQRREEDGTVSERETLFEGCERKTNRPRMVKYDRKRIMNESVFSTDYIYFPYVDRNHRWFRRSVKFTREETIISGRWRNFHRC